MNIRNLIKEELSKFNIPAGSIIKKEGIPFKVEEEIVVSGTDGNAKIAKLKEHIRKAIREELISNKSELLGSITVGGGNVMWRQHLPWLGITALYSGKGPRERLSLTGVRMGRYAVNVDTTSFFILRWS